MKLHSRIFGKVLVALLLPALFLVSCRDPQLDPISVTFKSTEASAEAGSQFVSVTAVGEWSLTIVVDGSDDVINWAWIGTFSGDEQSVTLNGSGSDNTVVFNWAENLSVTPRTCRLVLSCGGQEASYTFSQQGADRQQTTADDLREDEVQPWLELPSTAEGDGLYFITHSMKLGTREVRNYSFYWDPQELVARWVAYPLNRSLIGSGSRTNEWGLDPKVPQKYQPVIFGGFRGGYQRGHQMPSADRLSHDANVMTFYGTNMTPQLGDLNEEAWVGLEGMVRNWCYSFDTLYVVTGCVTKGSTSYAYDNEGKKVTVPTGYFKALLGYKKNASIAPATKGYCGIAFYFDHKYYPNDRSEIMKHSMPIDALETKTGLDFFVNLKNVIGVTLAEKVEATTESFWNNN